MKAFKIILALVGLVVIIAVGGILYLASNLDRIVKELIESEGPKVTQTEVTVADVDIQLRDGRGQLSGFRIANPPGFDTPDAMMADTLVLDIEPASIARDVVVINEIVVGGVNVVAEQKGMTTNLQALLKAVREAAGEGESTEAEQESDLRLMVERIRFSDSSLALVTEEYGNYDMALPPLSLDNIGTREKGLTPAELGREILRPVIEQARETAQQRLEELVRQKAGGELERRAREQLGEDADEKIQRLKGILNR